MWAGWKQKRQCSKILCPWNLPASSKMWMPFPLSFGADFISAPFVVLMSWKLNINLCSSADFWRGKFVLSCAPGGLCCCCSAVVPWWTVLMQDMSSCPLAARDGSCCLSPSLRWNCQASSTFLPNFVITSFCEMVNYKCLYHIVQCLLEKSLSGARCWICKQ